MAEKKATTKKKGVKSSLVTKVIILAALVFVGVQVYLLHGRISEAKAEEAALAAQISLQQQTVCTGSNDHGRNAIGFLQIGGSAQRTG